MIESSSWIELSESALRKNLKTLRRVIGNRAEFCSVVKANAYGHGLDPFIPLAEECGIRRFGVFSAEEAELALRCRRSDSRIMIMGCLADADVRWAVENEISFFVFDLSRLEAAEKAARRVGKPAMVHLEVETGMHRLGLSLRSLKAAARRVQRRPDLLQAEGVCSHFAGAESSANHQRIQEQIKRFQTALESLEQDGLNGFHRHLCCSAAAFLYPEAVFEMVRFGIAQYGFWPSLETRMMYQHGNGKRRTVNLERVLSWHSRVINIKSVPSGQFVGYGNSFLTTRKSRIAAVPVGYHHGIERNQSNLGHVLIHGTRCPIAGVINMNMMSVDVSHLENVRVGDEVVIVGHQGDDEITVGAFGNRINDLNYETLARLHGRIRRVVTA